MDAIVVIVVVVVQTALRLPRHPTASEGFLLLVVLVVSGKWMGIEMETRCEAQAEETAEEERKTPPTNTPNRRNVRNEKDNIRFIKIQNHFPYIISNGRRLKIGWMDWWLRGHAGPARPIRT